MIQPARAPVSGFAGWIIEPNLEACELTSSVRCGSHAEVYQPTQDAVR